MESQGKDTNSKVSRITLKTYLQIPLPCILIGGALGVLIGSASGNEVWGLRIGIILGSVVAFILMLRKKRNAS